MAKRPIGGGIKSNRQSAISSTTESPLAAGFLVSGDGILLHFVLTDRLCILVVPFRRSCFVNFVAGAVSYMLVLRSKIAGCAVPRGDLACAIELGLMTATATIFRIRKHADYQRVYKASRKQFAKQMTYFFTLRPELGPDGNCSARRGRNESSSWAYGWQGDGQGSRPQPHQAPHAGGRSEESGDPRAPVDVVLHPRRSVIDLEFRALEREVAAVFRAIQSGGQKQQSRWQAAPCLLTPCRTRSSTRASDWLCVLCMASTSPSCRPSCMRSARRVSLSADLLRICLCCSGAVWGFEGLVAGVSGGLDAAIRSRKAGWIRFRSETPDLGNHPSSIPQTIYHRTCASITARHQPDLQYRIGSLFWQSSKTPISRAAATTSRLLVMMLVLVTVFFGLQYLPLEVESTDGSPNAAPAFLAAPAGTQTAGTACDTARCHPAAGQQSAPAASLPGAAPAAHAVPAIQASAESTTVVENELYRITFTNRGGQVTSWILKQYKDSDGNPLNIVHTQAAEKFGYPLSLYTYDAALTTALSKALYVPSATGTSCCARRL